MARDALNLIGLARDWMKQGNTAVAIRLLNEALNLSSAEPGSTIKGEISKEFGRVYMQTGQWDRAETACQEAANVFLENNNYKNAAESVRNLANIKFQLGQFADSYSLCERAIDCASKSEDFQLRATILNTQGAIRSMEGNHEESIRIFKLCLSDFRRSGNTLHQAYVVHNIGLAQLEIGQLQESKKNLEEALVLALEQKDTNLVEMCYQNIARLHLKSGDVVAARSLIRVAKDLARFLKSPNLDVDLALIEARSFRLSADLEQSEKVLRKALEKARKHNLIQHEAELLLEAGDLASERGDLDLARSRLEAAIALFRKTGGVQLGKALTMLKGLTSGTGNLKLHAEKN